MRAEDRARRVLVVGGSSGIGNGIAQAFAADGAAVHVWGSRASAADYAGDPGSDLDGLGYTQVDLGNLDAIEAAAAPFAALDILVLSQGTVEYGRAEFAREPWDRVMTVNLDSVMACCRKFQSQLAAGRGAILIVSSVAAFGATIGNPAYAASKAALVNLTRTLGKAWAPDGIRVNGIAPGLVETKLTRITTSNPKRRAASLVAIPAGRIGTPADMAAAALFLCSPAASYVVGQTLVVDGGLTL